jgi:signal peptidase I
MALGLLLLISYAFFGTVLVRVSGHSMSPTLGDGSWILVDKLQLPWQDIKEGDIILIRSSDNELVVKRVVLRDTSPLLWQEDQLYIPLYAGYLSLAPHIKEDLMQQGQLQPEQLFILGDNIPISYDSRSYGAISQQQVIGRVIVSSH